MNKEKIAETTANIQRLIDFNSRLLEIYKIKLSFFCKQQERMNNILSFGEKEPIINAYLVIQSHKYRENMTIDKLLERINKELAVAEENMLKDLEKTGKLLAESKEKYKNEPK